MANRIQIIPILLALSALLLYWSSIQYYRFDGLYGQDTFGYYQYAQIILEHAQNWRLPPPYYWPLGYPALTALATSFTGLSPLAGQLISTLAGSGVVALVYLLTTELLEQDALPAPIVQRASLIAGLLVLGSGQLWQWSITVMADTAALCWATLAAFLIARYARNKHQRWLIFAAIALACAITTRWVYGLLVLPFGCFWLIAIYKPRYKVAHFSIFLPIAYAILAGVLALTPQLLVSAGRPAVVLEHQWLLGWSPLNALRSEFATPDGSASYPLPVGLFYARAVVSPRFMAPLFGPFLLLGIWLLFRRQMWQTLALAGSWGMVMYLFLSGVPYQNIRFTLALLPPVAIITALGFGWAWDALLVRVRPIVIFIILFGLLGGVWYSSRTLDQFMAHKQSDLAVAYWVEQQLPAHASLLAFELTLTLQHYTALDVQELFGKTPASLTTTLQEARPHYLIIDTNDLEGQWKNTPLAQTYHWLRDEVGLEIIGQKNNYTLFRIIRTK